MKVTTKGVHKCITKARDSTYFYLGWGPCSAIKIAKTTMTADEVVENIMAGVKAVVKHIPKGIKGIQAIHIKTDDSIALPIYNSLAIGMKIDAGFTSTKAGSNNKSNKRNAASVSKQEEEDMDSDGSLEMEDDDEEEEAEPSAKRAKAAKQLEFTTGEALLADRKGVWEEATLIGKSAKKEGEWKVKFASDGKVFARPEAQLKPVEDDEQ